MRRFTFNKVLRLAHRNSLQYSPNSGLLWCRSCAESTLVYDATCCVCSFLQFEGIDVVETTYTNTCHAVLYWSFVSLPANDVWMCGRCMLIGKMISAQHICHRAQDRFRVCLQFTEYLNKLGDNMHSISYVSSSQRLIECLCVWVCAPSCEIFHSTQSVGGK